MSDAATLLAEFVDQLHAGAAPDAGEFLGRAGDDAQRQELAEGIEAVLMFVPEAVRHPRNADGSFVLGLDKARIDAITQVTWPEALPAWMHAAELDAAQLAAATLAEGGIDASEENVRAATGWIESIQAGSETIRSISTKARAAIADALKVARDAFDAAGDFEPQGAIAFRAGDSDDAIGLSHSLMQVSAELDMALPHDDQASEVDAFFSA